jgi:hypothetical protein
MDQILTFFPTTVYRSSAPAEITALAKELVLKEPELYHETNYWEDISPGADVDVEFGHSQWLLNKIEWYPVKSVILEKMDYFLKNVLGAKPDIYPVITNSWACSVFPGQVLSQHTHPNSFLTAVFWIQVDPELDYCRFVDHHQRQILLQASENEYNRDNYDVPAKDGDIIVFMSNVWHGIPKPRQSSVRPRISLSANSWIKGTSTKETYFFWEDDNQRPKF